jgi:hypothetical protein
MFMKREVSFYLLIVTLLSFVIAQPIYGEDSRCRISKEALKEASIIRGLEIKEETPCLLHGKEQVKSYLLETINTKIPRERLIAESTIYKAFGFLPQDFDYEKGLVDLYLDQLGGYYDPDKNHYVMASWIPDVLQTSVAVHELTHALQDQHFDLNSLTKQDRFSSDELMARSALIEGDATAVMMDYTYKLVGQPPLSKKDNVSSIILQNSLGTMLMPGLAQIPLSLKLILMFPYSSGLRLAHEGLKKGGYEQINRMFVAPPRSTEEVLHPEKYFDTTPSFKKIDLAASEDQKLLFSDTLGEFALSALMATHEIDKSKVALASSGWGGDKVILVENSAGKKEAVWKIAWDMPKDAQEFCQVYRGILPKIKVYGNGQKASALEIQCDTQETTLLWREP